MREQADGALAAFGQDAVDQARPGILKDALRGSFWKAVWSSMVAGFFYSLALIALVLILRWNGVDVLGLFQKLDVLGPQTSTKAPAPTSQPPSR